MIAVLAAGAGVSLARAGAVTGRTAMRALLSGLFGLVLFQFTVGNVWGYAVEYRNSGGEWTDRPFLTPFVLAVVAGVSAGFARGSVALGAWVAFWTFVVVAAAVALGTWMVAGYHEAGG
jgi:hypothetical protein